MYPEFDRRACPEFIEGSKGCFFVPVLNHVLTIGQDLFSIKTKKLERKVGRMKKIDLKILFLKYLAFTAMIQKTPIINDAILQHRHCY